MFLFEMKNDVFVVFQKGYCKEKQKEKQGILPYERS